MKIVHRDDYRARRAADYPPLTELADALVHQQAGDGSKLCAYLDACRAVKARYPKPDPAAPKSSESKTT
ncbi:hypothetical protein [Bosea vaviloviae]|uniref:Uncharacterized protein n=1 Tax=Bosea vaviloviae TaxID=1526658 RepID=A0A1D7U2R3_9HYPH|nr:hypothetical protein [Bosea vaviloviae]AOO81660.1 hypothetical protein BHK69_15435 [Bosea vaviloviae]